MAYYWLDPCWRNVALNYSVSWSFTTKVQALRKDNIIARLDIESVAEEYQS